MNKLKFPVIFAVFILVLNSCKQDNYYEENTASDAVAADSIADEISPEAPLNSTAATYQDPKRKFIRTADLSMEVEDVYRSTTKIESSISRLGGFVTESRLNSRILSAETFPVNSDSALEVRKYAVNNEISLRIPQKELGEFLFSLGEEMKFLYFRNISAQDVSLNFIIAELEKERLNSANDKLDDLANEKGKIKDKQSVINNVNSNQSEINNKKIRTMKMDDEVAYSTVTLLIAEKTKIAETMVINPKTYEDKYRPGFFYRAKVSATEGFYFFQTICIGLLYVWPLWLLGILVYFFVKFQRKKTETF